MLFLPSRVRALYTLPCDVLELIAHHHAQMVLAARARHRSMRHAYRRAWPELRRRLVPACTSEEFAIMQRCSWVRREWRQEPASWLYMLVNEPRNLRRILSELKCRRVVHSIVQRMMMDLLLR